MGITPKNPADFDPTMGNYKDLRPFRFWCQKVLPLVYDDSLSYYEVLCKVVDYLNKAMEDIGVLHDDVDALHTAYQQLQSYVNDYFSTLDVQEEINNKLDVMASDGTLDALLLPYFNNYKAEINAVISQQNQTIASQNTNINTLSARMDTFTRLAEGSTTGDAELTDIRVAGNGITYPTAGDAVREQYDVLNNGVLLTNKGLQTFRCLGNFQHYGLKPDGTFDTTQNYRVSNDDPIVFERDIIINIAPGFHWGYITFSGATADTWSGWFTFPTVIPKGTPFVIQIARISEVLSETADVEEFLSKVTFYDYAGDCYTLLNPNETKSFNGSDFQNGIWEDGKIANAPTRICTKNFYVTKKGDSFVYTLPSNLAIIYGIMSPVDGSNIFASSWILGDNTEKTFTLQNDGLFFFQIRKSDNAPISVSDLDGTFTLNYGTIKSVKELYDKTSVIIDAKAFNIEQGTINPNGTQSSTSKTVRTKNYIPYIYKGFYETNGRLQYGFHFYDKDYKHLSNTTWLQDSDYNIPDVENCVYMKMVFSKINNTDILPAEVDDNSFLTNNINTLTVSMSDQVQKNTADISAMKKPYAYYGDPIPTAHSFGANIEIPMYYNVQTQTPQDMDIFGDYMFVAYSGAEQLMVYSMITNEKVGDITVETNHGSGVQFSSEYYANDDDFPLLYVGGWTDNIINVIRIQYDNTNDTWNGSIVRQLYIPTSYGYYFAPSIDKTNNIMYGYGYKLNTVGVQDNAMKLVKCNLDNLTYNQDGTYTPEILDSMEMEYEGIMQGRCYYDGHLFVGFAWGVAPHEPRLISIDVNTGVRNTDIDMTQLNNLENEGVCYRIVGNKIEWYYSDYNNIFKLSF